MLHTTLCRCAVAVVLVLLGWAAGRAQTATPEFEFVVDAPGGETRITCVRGCELQWVERGVNPNGRSTPNFTYGCNAGRCESGRVGGWIRP
jgi:hypothetical protein